MSRKIILSADSTCDIGPELQALFNVQFFHYHIQIGNESYVDAVEITPAQIFAAWYERGILPKTAAVTPTEYKEYFRGWVEAGYDVIHINLGSALTSAYQNCMIAANELGHIYPVDSANLSTGSGHLVVKAGELIAKGHSAPEIVEQINTMRSRVQSSFIIDTMEFLKAGGRCNALVAFGANLLSLKPCIEVNNHDGSMSVGRKYRGKTEKVLMNYIKDKLEGRDDIDLERIFLTHSGYSAEDLQKYKDYILSLQPFRELHTTHTSGTISAHCGPGTMGVLFMTKQ